jgi:hypothetical protein
MFHLCGKVFRPQELVNPLAELGNAGVVLSAEVHTEIMAQLINLISSFAKKIGFSAFGSAAFKDHTAGDGKRT